MYRESLWDDSTRARAMRLQEHKVSIDSTTGLPVGEAYKPQKFVVSSTVNHAALALEMHKDNERREAEREAKRANEDFDTVRWERVRSYSIRPATAKELEEDERGD